MTKGKWSISKTLSPVYGSNGDLVDQRMVIESDQSSYSIAYIGGLRISESASNAQAIASLPELIAEHEKWAHEFAWALLMYLQGGRDAIEKLSQDLIIDYDRNGEPTLRSEVLARLGAP